MYQVYKITNKINGMVYIGSSVNVERRWRQHKEASFNKKDHHYNYPLMITFREYGIDNFYFEIIDTLYTKEEMIKTEYDWIIKENSVVPFGYNQTKNTNTPMFDPIVVEKVKSTKRKKYGKRVCEIDLNNNIINIWNSLAEASEKNWIKQIQNQ